VAGIIPADIATPDCCRGEITIAGIAEVYGCRGDIAVAGVAAPDCSRGMGPVCAPAGMAIALGGLSTTTPLSADSRHTVSTISIRTESAVVKMIVRGRLCWMSSPSSTSKPLFWVNSFMQDSTASLISSSRS